MGQAYSRPSKNKEDNRYRKLSEHPKLVQFGRNIWSFSKQGELQYYIRWLMSNPTLMGKEEVWYFGFSFVVVSPPIYITRIFAATCLLPLVLLLCPSEKGLAIFCILPSLPPPSLQVVELQLDFPLSLFFCRLNKHCSLSLLSYILCSSC